MKHLFNRICKYLYIIITYYIFIGILYEYLFQIGIHGLVNRLVHSIFVKKTFYVYLQAVTFIPLEELSLTIHASYFNHKQIVDFNEFKFRILSKYKLIKYSWATKQPLYITKHINSFYLRENINMLHWFITILRSFNCYLITKASVLPAYAKPNLQLVRNSVNNFHIVNNFK